MTEFQLPELKNKRTGTVAVLGAGPTGLSTAWRLAKHGWKVTVIEKDTELGGHGGTRTIHGYNVDDGPHKLYPQVPCAKPLIDHFVGADLLITSKKSTIYLDGKYIPFPFGLGDLFKGLGIGVGIRCGISYVLGKIQSILKGKPKTYSDFVVAQYGSLANKLVFRQVAEKLWGNPDELHVQLAKTRIIAPNLIELIKSLLFGMKNKPALSAEIFYYPKNGLRQLWEAMGKEIESLGGTIVRNTKPSQIMRKGQGFRIALDTSENIQPLEVDALVSTIPIKTTVRLFEPKAAETVYQAAENLKASSLLVLYVVVNTPRLLPVNWIFFPESNIHFGRISEQKGFSESMIPADRTVLVIEIPLARESIRNIPREQIIQESLEQLRRVNVIKPEHKILETFTGYDDSIYPIYDLPYQKNLQTILDWSDSLPNFYLNGRLGLFCYNNMDHSMEMGLSLADYMTSSEPIDAWRQRRKNFYDYKIVD